MQVQQQQDFYHHFLLEEGMSLPTTAPSSIRTSGKWLKIIQKKVVHLVSAHNVVYFTFVL
jgi:hypothetical protein